MTNISIIVPVCNVETKLRGCLDSLIHQTMSDIEIICVDDFSQDGCAAILEEYAKKDSRIVNIFHSVNMSTSQARKDGVLASRGKYIMFVDADDFLEPKACELAFDAIEKNRTDIVQFGVNIVNCTGVPESRIASNQKAVMPYLSLLEEEDNLIRPCWESHYFGFSLWSKIYKGDLCRKAFSAVEDGYFPKAQDLYAFFLIAYYAKTSAGIEDVLYNYNFGIGVTGGAFLTWKRFEMLMTQRNVYEALERFLIKEGRQDDYKDILQIIYQHFINECVCKWNDNLRAELASKGFQKLVDVWGFEEVLCKLAERYWFSRYRIAEKMSDVDYFKHQKRPEGKKLTIAAYYRLISNGGAQRVVASLCNIWASLKDENGEPLYRVVLITDEEPQENEYHLEPNVQRAFLPDNEMSMKKAYRERFQAWNKIIDDYQIDIVVSSMWVAPCTFWDMLCVKGHKSKPAFVLHSHNFCCIPYRFSGRTGLELTYSYQLFDGVVTLSECDRKFVSSFSHHVKYIVNPISFQSKDVKPSRYESDTLVWVGRISWEKQPLEAIYAMEYIVREIPNAKLYMVGDGDELLTEKIKEVINQLKLEDHVILTGFTQEVEAYYQRAMVYVGTSSYEGFSLTFCEAMSHSVPIVSYEMPWLTFMQDGRGIVSVKQKRPDLLAKECIRFLRDSRLCKTVGSQGREQVLEMEQVDIGREWKDLFDRIGIATETSMVLSDEAIIYKYMSCYQQMGKDSIRGELEKRLRMARDEKSEINRKRGELEKRLRMAWDEKSEINRKLQITYKEKYDRGVEIKKLNAHIEMLEHSTTFKVGRVIMYIPTHLKKWIKAIILND